MLTDNTVSRVCLYNVNRTFQAPIIVFVVSLHEKMGYKCHLMFRLELVITVETKTLFPPFLHLSR